MRRAFRVLPLALLAACGGRAASAQTPTPAPMEGLARPYLYEVAATPQERQTAPFIEVSGSASVSVSPDRARVSFAVESQGKTAAEASGANADAMDAVMRALRGAGVAGLRVETFGYVLRPDYAVPTVQQGGQRVREIAGYTALNNVRVTLDDVAAVGRVIDLAIGAGANRVASLAFEASDTEAARREALAAAVRQATLQAESIAAALGQQLGAPLEVHGGAQAPSPRPQMDVVMYRTAEMAAETPVEAGDQTVNANVTIRFALGPAAGGR